MLHEEICTYEVCKLAKEKGFNKYEACNHIYEDGTQWHTLTTYTNAKGIDWSKDKFTVAPTQALLQRWLREVHNLHIDVGVWEDRDEDADGLCCGTYSYWSFNIQSCFTGDLIYEEFDHRYDTYELALEDGLKYALETLI